MLYSENYWVSGLCLLFSILNTRKYYVLESGSFSRMLHFLDFTILVDGKGPETQ
jgi:hypothetical protein